ncbi:TRAP transporter small permease [Desulfoluna spongiiphila]|uniref:TRAP-type C4-dicarboxylate transport system, small permease component n=1 Tax=Desulfoluna spongiiphila TaxID=419481 RepID=A0A1G5BSD7_9BACT|nr:TRAP transporter small permease [Desulfoluna spongiiphila]SCX92987.1 TRAP-type C4-dicarboxylate transport system, small permease component [Desulfoluna spongiiphila]
MIRAGHLTTALTKGATFSSWLAAACLLGMMGATCLDVALRFFRYPIAGAYETVGFLGALMVAFALADTTLKGGHIAVEFLADKLPPAPRKWLNRTVTLVLIILFGLLTLRMGRHALELKEAAEVSMTLKIPVWPVVTGITAGMGLFVAVLVTRLR